MAELNDNQKITIKREIDESYEIIFGDNLFPRIASDLKQTPIGERYAIITDSNVERLYADSLLNALKREELDATIFSFEAGEPNKTMETCMKIVNEMSELKFNRESAIIALGGGVVGDMAGFIAAIFNRGIRYIQIPTTIVAQADSSIGGKTAVNTEYGKNLIGTFKQPTKVYMDITTLFTLSNKDYASGLAETIKHAIIYDFNFFRYLSENINLMKQKDPSFLLYIAKSNCRIKGKIVEIDPFEKGIRKILNYGHTAGHAIEKLSVDKYNRKESKSYLSHGESIAIGMMIEARIAHILGYFSNEDLAKQEKLLLAANLPIKIPEQISNEEIIEVTTRDKKSKNSQAMYALPAELGKMKDFQGEYVCFVDDKIVLEALRQTR